MAPGRRRHAAAALPVDRARRLRSHAVRDRHRLHDVPERRHDPPADGHLAARRQGQGPAAPDHRAAHGRAARHDLPRDQHDAQRHQRRHRRRGAGRRLRARRRRQVGHDQRSARCLVRRLHAGAADGGLGRHRRQPAARPERHAGGAADLDDVHDADLGIPDEVVDYIALSCRFDARDTQRALRGTDITTPPLSEYATKIWDYWERTLDPDLYKDRSFEGAINGKTVVITGASSGIGRAAALKIAAAGGIPILVARTKEKLDEVKAEIEAAGGTAYVAPCDLSDFDAIEKLVETLLADHARIDMLVNNAGRSIRRSVALSYDRFHDYERTVHLNYLSPVKLMLGLLPHMRDQGGGHIVNVSSIGVQTSPPRFSAYVGSKAALDAFTRVVASETIGDNVTFTTIHMPLVRTPMIAPTKMYDSFPTISPRRPRTSCARRSAPSRSRSTPSSGRSARSPTRSRRRPSTRSCTSRTGCSRSRPRPRAARATRRSDKASGEATALAYLMKGVHW